MPLQKQSKVRVVISYLWRSLLGDWRAWVPSRGNVLFTLLVVSLFWVQGAGALPFLPAAPNTSSSTISYQGYLADSSGNPVNSTLDMAFRLYNVTSGGTALWSETHSGVQVSEGLFSVLLGSNTAISQDIFANNSDLWLGITIGSDSEMLPREKIASAPYAMISNVPDGSITEAKLANNAVTSAKLAEGTVGSGDVANDSLTASDLASNSVGSAEIANDAVGSSEIANDAVGNSEMADNAIGTNEVINDSLTASDLAAGSVGSSEVADNTLTASDLADNSVGAAELASNSIYSGDIRDGEVNTADIADGDATSRKVHLTNGHVTTTFTDLNTSWQTLNNSTTTFSVETSSTVLLAANCEFQINGMDRLAEAKVYVDGSALSSSIVGGNEPPYGPSNLLYKWRGTVGMNYLFNVGSGSHTILIKGRTTSGTAHAWVCDYSYIAFARYP